MTPARPDYYTEGGRPRLTKGPDRAFDGYNTVAVHYCSSDGWVGSLEGDQDAPYDGSVPFGTEAVGDPGTDSGDTGAPDPYRIHFRGKAIVQAVIQDVQDRYDLRGTAEDIVVLGLSAGSIAVQSHLDKFADAYGAGTLRGLAVDTFVPYLPDWGTSVEAEGAATALGLSKEERQTILARAVFDDAAAREAIRQTLTTWGALERVDSEGWPGPRACFEAEEDPASCVLAPVVYGPRPDGPYLSQDILILRNSYDVAVHSAALGLFPDNEAVTEEAYAMLLAEMTRDVALAPMDGPDSPLDSVPAYDPDSGPARALASWMTELTEEQLRTVAVSANVRVFAPRLEMTTTPGDHSEAARRAMPSHGIIDDR